MSQTRRNDGIFRTVNFFIVSIEISALLVTRVLGNNQQKLRYTPDLIRQKTLTGSRKRKATRSRLRLKRLRDEILLQVCTFPSLVAISFVKAEI